MKEEDLAAVLQDFGKRIEYARENMKKDEKEAPQRLKALFEAKSGLLDVIDGDVKSILECFKAVAVLDAIIKKGDKHAEKLQDEELSKYDKD